MNNRYKILVEFMFLLVIALQGILPFLHAHTGMSSVTGIHGADLIVGHHHTYQSSKLEVASKPSEESYAVQVGSELSNEDERLAFDQIFIRNGFWVLNKPSATINFTAFLATPDREPLSFYSSEHYPPPSLAPPTQLL